MGTHLHSELPEFAGEVHMVRYRRVTMVAHHPQVHSAPTAVRLRVPSDGCGNVVDEPERTPHAGGPVTAGVCCLVAGREGGEYESWSLTPDARDQRFGQFLL